MEDQETSSTGDDATGKPVLGRGSLRASAFTPKTLHRHSKSPCLRPHYPVPHRARIHGRVLPAFRTIRRHELPMWVNLPDTSSYPTAMPTLRRPPTSLLAEGSPLDGGRHSRHRRGYRCLDTLYHCNRRVYKDRRRSRHKGGRLGPSSERRRSEETTSAPPRTGGGIEEFIRTYGFNTDYTRTHLLRPTYDNANTPTTPSLRQSNLYDSGFYSLVTLHIVIKYDTTVSWR